MKSCRRCAGYDDVIRAELRRNERREANGKPVDLTGINRARADKQLCATRGHRNVPADLHRKKAVPTSP